MRLLTRSDFDGLACAVLLRELGYITEYRFVHPKDMQDGAVAVTENDVLANVPFVPGCGLWFDHHSSEVSRGTHLGGFKGSFRHSPSCARVIWDYYGGHQNFSRRLDPMLEAVDRSDSGNLTIQDIEHPRDWILLSFVMDPRTGLGRYRDYRISNYQLMTDLVEYCRTRPIQQILCLPDVKERLQRYRSQTARYREMLRRRARQKGDVVLVDLREQQEILTGNRFIVYTMFPTANISLQVMWGRDHKNIVFTCGHSITNRTSKTDVGKLMLEYGGGGHQRVGTCQVPVEAADRIKRELVARLNGEG
jgi:nanoRNase/pAp phosphatase (c-di-AMP/oligoRNAs hydrolase)